MTDESCEKIATKNGESARAAVSQRKTIFNARQSSPEGHFQTADSIASSPNYSYERCTVSAEQMAILGVNRRTANQAHLEY